MPPDQPSPATTPNPIPDSTPVESPPPAIDHSKLQSIYPQVNVAPAAAAKPPAAKEKQNIGSTLNLYDLITLVSGIASTGLIYILLLTKNLDATIAVCSLLVAIAILFSIKTFRMSGQTSPFAVIGISAATSTLVYLLSLLLIRITHLQSF